METGHVLWLAHTKKKQAACDFCDFVGEDRMSKVAAVACDMNADFEAAFPGRRPHLKAACDRFHLVKNLDEKVISAVRKDEQARPGDEGLDEEAKALKGSKRIPMAKASTRSAKDRDARAGKTVIRGGELFGKREVVQAGGNRKRREGLIGRNELLAACDIVKELLAKAYGYKQEKRMLDTMEEVVAVCRGTGDKHFEWFARLAGNHMDGIVAHARYPISSGKVEGTNAMIKALRRTGYGHPDDERFFLKIFDASRHHSPSRKEAVA